MSVKIISMSKRQFAMKLATIQLCLKFYLQMAEILEMDFVIVDETVNRYGWRLLIDGIDTSGFMKNPVCPVQHNTYEASIGKWKNFRKDNGRLIGTLEFDPEDEQAVKLYRKYKNGYMNAVSVSIIPIEESEDPQYLLPGQKYPTITKSELLEVSVVTVPGQKNSVKLCKPDGSDYRLSLITKHTTMTENVEQLKQELEQARRLNAENLIKLHKTRGVVTDAEADELIALAQLDYERVSRLLDARQPVQDKTGENLAKQLVAMHASRLGLTPDEIAMYEKAAQTDYEATRKALEARKGKEVIDAFVSGMQTPENRTDDRAKWTFLDYYKNDPLALEAMAKNDPERFKRLEAEFLDESKKLGCNITPA